VTGYAEGSAARENAPKQTRDVNEWGRDWQLATLLVGGALAIYATIGLGIYQAVRAFLG
jgi:hypothetical protein